MILSLSLRTERFCTSVIIALTYWKSSGIYPLLLAMIIGHTVVIKKGVLSEVTCRKDCVLERGGAVVGSWQAGIHQLQACVSDENNSDLRGSLEVAAAR